MYTSYIGNRFLSIYRQRNNLPDDYTAQQFFDDVLFPVFFDDEKFFMSVHSSPFDQLFAESGAKLKKHVKENPNQPFVPLHKVREHRVRKLEELHQKIGNGEIGGNTAVGYYSLDMEATTSGQVTSMSNFVTSEDLYASWIGHGLSVRVDGAIILIDNETVLWTLFEGWKLYREYLVKTPSLKDKQVEAWNGYWLCHVFGKSFDKENVWGGFHINVTESKGEDKKSKVFRIPPIDWIKVIFTLAYKFPRDIMTLYAYSLSKTNTTYGFIYLNLPEVKKPIDIYDELFLIPNNVRNQSPFVELYTTFYTFKNACMLGTIGLKALEPAKLRDFMPRGSAKYAGGQDFKFTSTNLKPKKNEDAEKFEVRLQKIRERYTEEIINFQIFKTWIIAMLNNKKELNSLAEQVAQALIDFENNDKLSSREKTKTSTSKLSEEVKSSKSLREFIEKLTDLMSKYQEGASVFKKVKDAVLELPSDLFPLFITLIRFEYQFKKSI